MIKTLLANLAYQRILKDASVWTLLTVNVITIFVAVIQQWSFGTVLWVYWSQSMIIGIFTFLNTVGFKNFSKDSLESKIRKTDGYSFLLIHSIFHLSYMVLLAEVPIEDFSIFIAVVGLFLANHAFSAIKNRNQNSHNNTTIDKIVSIGMIRTIPIVIAIMFLWLPSNIIKLTSFMLIKVILDIGGHIYKHRPRKKTT